MNKMKVKLSVVAHACHPIITEVKGGQVFKASPEYAAEPNSKTTKIS